MAEEGENLDLQTQQVLRVAIVDDHVILVDALQMFLGSQVGIGVVGTGHTCEACLQIVSTTQPQVLILDVALPDGDGIDLIPAIKEAHAETNVLILTSFNDEATIRRAMQAGASGFLPKSQNLPELLNAVAQAANGEIVMPPSLLVSVLSRAESNHEDCELQISLSQRELEILQLLSQGQSVASIAVSLYISVSTTRTHIRNLMKKMGVRSQLQAVAEATRRGWIDSFV
jgi:DNA-binding NarL/FixJ family response regulator